jgi:hypothetical protein
MLFRIFCYHALSSFRCEVKHLSDLVPLNGVQLMTFRHVPHLVERQNIQEYDAK